MELRHLCSNQKPSSSRVSVQLNIFPSMTLAQQCPQKFLHQRPDLRSSGVLFVQRLVTACTSTAPDLVNPFLSLVHCRLPLPQRLRLALMGEASGQHLLIDVHEHTNHRSAQFFGSNKCSQMLFNEVLQGGLEPSALDVVFLLAFTRSGQQLLCKLGGGLLRPFLVPRPKHIGTALQALHDGGCILEVILFPLTLFLHNRKLCARA